MTHCMHAQYAHCLLNISKRSSVRQSCSLRKGGQKEGPWQAACVEQVLSHEAHLLLEGEGCIQPAAT